MRADARLCSRCESMLLMRRERQTHLQSMASSRSKKCCGLFCRTLIITPRDSSAVPSTMGTLMASGLMNTGKVLKGTEQLTSAQEAQLFEAYLEGVKNRGKAEVGDKTFLDGLAPAVQALAQASQAGPIGAKEAQAAADAAWQAFENTRGMLAKHGRMAIRGEASRELLDPGAAVAALLMKGYAEFKAD